MTKSGAKSKNRKPAAPAAKQEKGMLRETAGFACLGLAAMLVYFFIANAVSGSAQGVIDVLAGLAGILCYLLPVALGWLGLRVACSPKIEKAHPGRIVLTAFFALAFAALVHVFSADAIVQRMAIRSSFVNFVLKSYEYKVGGAGALGALLCWPLYWTLGMDEWGAGLLLFLLLLGDLLLMQKLSIRRLGEKVQHGYTEARDTIRQRMSERGAAGYDTELQRASRAPVPAQDARDEDEDDFFEEKKKEPPVKKQRPAKQPQREMIIEKVAPAPLPGEPPVQPVPETPESFASDVPDFLDAKRKRKTPKIDALHIEEPQPLFGKTRAAKKSEPAPVPAEDIADVSKETNAGETEFTGAPAEETAPSDELDVYATPAEEEIPPFDIPETDVIDEIPPVAATDVTTPLFTQKNPAIHIEEPALASSLEEKADKPEHEPEPYSYPPIDLLHAAKPQQSRDKEQITDQAKGQKLVETLASFGISVSLVGVAHGPTVTRFELSPAPGVKVSRITSLADDIALNLAAVSVRIEAPIPGKAAVGVEVPNDVVETVPLRDVLESDAARKNASRLASALGRDNAGRYIICDLSRMPHLLIAGQTGSGKSVCINCIICSILYRSTPEEVRLILIDPKVVELSVYNGIPHLLVPVVTDPKKAAGALEWAVAEMAGRYKKFADAGVRDMKSFNQHRPDGEAPMPQIVIIIDELADLMMVAPGDVEDAICRLAQLARAAGIYLVIATQRPSVNVITGVIKANIPSRIAFTVASQVDSRTILDYGGAEKLLGRGDMLYAPSGIGKPWRAQGAWVSEDEVHEIVNYIRARHDAVYNEDVIEHLNNCARPDAEKEAAAEEYDQLLPDAVEIVVEAGQASTSMLQRRMRIGYARAGRLIDEMEKRGIIGPGDGAKPRQVLISREQFKQMFGEDIGS